MKTKINTRNVFVFIATIVLVLIASSVVYSHCQIPCGIYDDNMRFKMMGEHITTIEKSMKSINQLSAEQKPDMNQIVRWVQNKETHADELSQIVSYYFMAQRIKTADKSDQKAYEKYVNKLTLLHQMLVYSMKAKQTTDLANIEKLRALLCDFRAAYLEADTHKH